MCIYVYLPPVHVCEVEILCVSVYLPPVHVSEVEAMCISVYIPPIHVCEVEVLCVSMCTYLPFMSVRLRFCMYLCVRTSCSCLLLRYRSN